eukprot:jgi/Psemu1/252376/estExt_Genewise1Plus.C_470005
MTFVPFRSALLLLIVVSHVHVSTGFVIVSAPVVRQTKQLVLCNWSSPEPKPQRQRQRRHLLSCLSKSSSSNDDDYDEHEHEQEQTNNAPIHYNDFGDFDDNNENENENDIDGSESGSDDSESELEPEPVLLCADARGRPAGVVLEDLSWRVEKLRLEEANKRRFLKAGPRFLPYEECRKWVQAWGLRWNSEEEWKDWIASGEKRNSYIPSRPEEYFTRTGDWISWEHFLGVPEKEGDSNDD